uniref:BZIP domain-containing protein n=1 Tax=Heterorhabditis bacteriophora TaxID=37862 RepID=A0A1I7X8E6_HETBA
MSVPRTIYLVPARTISRPITTPIQRAVIPLNCAPVKQQAIQRLEDVVRDLLSENKHLRESNKRLKEENDRLRGECRLTTLPFALPDGLLPQEDLDRIIADLHDDFSSHVDIGRPKQKCVVVHYGYMFFVCDYNPKFPKWTSVSYCFIIKLLTR